MLGLWIPDEQHGQFMRAAKRADKTLSEWLRDLGAREIAPPTTTTLTEFKGVPPVARAGAVQPKPGEAVLLVDAEWMKPRRTAAEIAAVIPGVKVGLLPNNGAIITEPQKTYQFAEDHDPNSFNVGNAPVEEVHIKPWLPVWRVLAPKVESEPGTFWDEIGRLAPGFKPAVAFWKLSLEAQAAALDEKYPLEVE